MITPDLGGGSAPHERIISWQQNRRIQELAALYAVSTAMHQALTEQEALGQALARALEVLELDAGKIYLLNPQTGQWELTATHGDLHLIDLTEAAITAGECLCGMVVQGGNALQSVTPAQDERIVREGCRRLGNHACAVVPLPAKERVLGVMHVAAQRSGAFNAAEMALLRSLGAQIGAIIENMRLREEARRAEGLQALLQEMHHRIKNNLQTVADLLSLELAAATSPEARHSLRDSISRIKSIAAVHQLLSLEHLRLTDITELARQVCDISLHQLTRPNCCVEAEVSGPPIYLPSKQATALALVMNELISNALEHAFEDGRPGRLAIHLDQEGPRVTVTVTDDGRGLPQDFDLERNGNLGLQIARTLVEKDLAGTLRLEPGASGGTRATLTFYR
ncbi:MAG: histidine kinase dimerization/phosphoacceptor domain -containing protein [Anaerolineae bacterium]